MEWTFEKPSVEGTYAIPIAKGNEMNEVEKLSEVKVETTLPPSRKQWVAAYFFRMSDGDIQEYAGCATFESPEYCYRIANTGSTIPGSIRIFEIPARKP